MIQLINPILGKALNTRCGSCPNLKNTGVSDWLTKATLSYTELLRKQGLNTTFWGFIFNIGRNGSEDEPNEWPAHLITPLIGGKIYAESTSYLTFDWMVWLSLTFLSRVLYGFAFSSLYSNYSNVFFVRRGLGLVAKNWRCWK